MTYQTNPIANRLGKTQGWLQEYFPQITNVYSNDVLTWYKLYIYINAFLKKKKINLISYSFQTDSKGILLLYLNVQKQLIKKKKSKFHYKLRTKRFNQAHVLAKYTGYYTKYNIFIFFRKKNKVGLGKKGFSKKLNRRTYPFRNKLTARDLKKLSLRLLVGAWSVIMNPAKLNLISRQKHLFSQHWILRNNLRPVLTICKISKAHCGTLIENKVNLPLFFPKKNCSLLYFKQFNFRKRKLFVKSYVQLKLKIRRKKRILSRKFRKQFLIPKKLSKIKFLSLRKKFRLQLMKHVQKFNFLRKKEFKLKKNALFQKRFTKKKRKKIGVQKISYPIKLLMCEQNLQIHLQKIFGLILLIKFSQTLHLMVNTKFMLSRKGRANLHFFRNFRKIRFLKNLVRSTFIFYKYCNLIIITNIFKQWLKKHRKKHRMLFECFRIFILSNKHPSIKLFKLILSGKINAKRRARTMTMGYKFEEKNRLPFAVFNTRMDISSTQAEAKTGSFFIKFITFSGASHT